MESDAPPPPDRLGLRSPFSTSISAPCSHFLDSLSASFISFRHPGYPDKHNLLFRLPALDGEGRVDTSPSGLHHGTALWACSIISCNLDGFLSPTRLRPGQSGVEPLTIDSLLTASEYYFYPSTFHGSQVGLDIQYPVCPSFDDWQFPIGQLPSEWRQSYSNGPGFPPPVPAMSQFSVAVTMRDVTCRVSGFRDGTQTAHLVPKEKTEWFERNEMGVYNLNNKLPSRLLTSDMQNCIRLRQDIHTQFDTGCFVFIPKCGSSHIHFLMLSHDYGRLYHNRESELIAVPATFLYARFAWAILPLAQAFTSRVGVKICVWCAVENDWVEKEVVADPPRSPAKRLRRASPVADDDGRKKTQMGSREGSRDSNANALDERYNHRKRAFDQIVLADPEHAWDNVNWHPETDHVQSIKEAYLSAREPLHCVEVDRQIRMMEGGIVLWEGEAASNYESSEESWE